MGGLGKEVCQGKMRIQLEDTRRQQWSHERVAEPSHNSRKAEACSGRNCTSYELCEENRLRLKNEIESWSDGTAMGSWHDEHVAGFPLLEEHDDARQAGTWQMRHDVEAKSDTCCIDSNVHALREAGTLREEFMELEEECKMAQCEEELIAERDSAESELTDHLCKSLQRLRNKELAYETVVAEEAQQLRLEIFGMEEIIKQRRRKFPSEIIANACDEVRSELQTEHEVLQRLEAEEEAELQSAIELVECKQLTLEREAAREKEIVRAYRMDEARSELTALLYDNSELKAKLTGEAEIQPDALLCVPLALSQVPFFNVIDELRSERKRCQGSWNVVEGLLEDHSKLPKGNELCDVEQKTLLAIENSLHILQTEAKELWQTQGELDSKWFGQLIRSVDVHSNSCSRFQSLRDEPREVQREVLKIEETNQQLCSRIKDLQEEQNRLIKGQEDLIRLIRSKILRIHNATSKAGLSDPMHDDLRRCANLLNS